MIMPTREGGDLAADVLNAALQSNVYRSARLAFYHTAKLFPAPLWAAGYATIPYLEPPALYPVR